MAVRARRTPQPSAPAPPPPPPVIPVAAAAPAAPQSAPADAMVKITPAAAPADPPSYRALRVYAFDPSRGRRLGNHMTVRVKYEQLQNRLEGDRLHVIDFDASNGIYYKPADLNSVAALVEGGLAPSESDPRFHQQMVYAVAMRTISIFERALGRDIRFRFGDATGPRSVLRIFPHAMYEPNAYYSRELGALLFGYFRASSEDAGTNLPGGTVFTCLSHDIIAHETTHAIMDTLRESFMEPTNPDVFAFHEAFADIVALFQHFAFEDVVRDTLQRTGGVLHRFELAPRGAGGATGAATTPAQQSFVIGELPEGNPLLDLARQFGESMGRRAALRSALGCPADPAALANATEAHSRGAVLVAAVFDAFFSSFLQRTADLIRMARSVAGGTAEIHPDIAARLAHEAAKVASQFCTMCIRAIDYCPPVDITFGDFLRALITADTELYQSEEHDYREALIQAFRARGIVPTDVVSLAEESLLWQKAEADTPPCKDMRFDIHEPHAFFDANCAALEKVVREHPFPFGLCLVKAHTKDTCDCKVPDSPRAVRSVNMVVRSGDRPQVEFVAEIIGSAPLDENDTKRRFRGGSTVVFDRNGKAKLIVYKNLTSKSRRKSMQTYLDEALAATAFANYTDITDAPLHLSAIHRGC
jgi:hypothetical protein